MKYLIYLILLLSILGIIPILFLYLMQKSIIVTILVFIAIFIITAKELIK